MAADSLGLIVGPLIAGLGLLQDFLGVRRCPSSETDATNTARMAMVMVTGAGNDRSPVFSVFLQFVDFFRHGWAAPDDIE